MPSKAALVIGTSRQDGNTWRVLQAANKDLQLPIFDLSALKISYFDYDSKNLNDDFIPTIEKLLDYDTIGLISPVYWYTVSAQMKTFLDRFSDLLGPRKDLGRRLRGKRLFLMATGSNESLPESMDQTIRLTANYLGMEFRGAHYSRAEDDLIPAPDTLERAKTFLESIVAAGD